MLKIQCFNARPVLGRTECHSRRIFRHPLRKLRLGATFVAVISLQQCFKFCCFLRCNPFLRFPSLILQPCQNPGFTRRARRHHHHAPKTGSRGTASNRSRHVTQGEPITIVEKHRIVRAPIKSGFSQQLRLVGDFVQRFFSAFPSGIEGQPLLRSFQFRPSDMITLFPQRFRRPH